MAAWGRGARRTVRVARPGSPQTARGRVLGQQEDSPAERLTARLHLRPWCDADRAPFAAVNADPEVMAHFPSTLTRAQSDARVDAFQPQFAARGWSNRAVVRRDDGRFLRFVGLSVPRRELPFGPCVEIGWRLARDAWGQEIASEAARQALGFGIEVFRLPTIVSFTALPNLRSRAVMERIGLIDSGQDFEHAALPVGHPLRTHCLYRLTRERWLAQRDPRRR